MSGSPAWRPDDQQPGQLRYWDGRQWTEWRVTAPTTVPAAQAAKRRGGLIAASVLGVVLLLMAVAALSGPGNEPGNETDANIAEAMDDPATTSSSSEPTPTQEPTPERADVPKLIGQDVRRARSRLVTSGLDVDVRRVVSVKRPGTVLRQSRRAGRAVLLGSAVTLVVSAPWPRVPEITGLSAAAATSRLRNAGFRVSTALRRTTSGRDSLVLSQNVSRRPVQPHSTIRLVVSDLHKPAPPPPAPVSNCTSGYSPCLTPMYDYDCAGGSGDGPGYTGLVRVSGSDPYDLDRDGDGIACED